jgi:hypothetical protein
VGTLGQNASAPAASPPPSPQRQPSDPLTGVFPALSAAAHNTTTQPNQRAEYNEWVDSPFNDVFGFWVSGPGIVGTDGSNRLNIAYLPDRTTPCSINNINNGKYSQYYNDNDAEPRPTV